MNRQRLILFILLILLGCVVLWSYNAMPRPKKVSSLTFKQGQLEREVATVTNKSDRVADDGTKLKINLLKKEQTGFKGYHRNIFRSIFIEEPKIVKRKPEVIKLPPPAVVTPVTPVPEKPYVAPLAHFTFLGFLHKGAVRTVFLAKDNDILLVKKGDLIEGRYKATDISDQSLTLTVTDTGGKIVIPLMENTPLRVLN